MVNLEYRRIRPERIVHCGLRFSEQVVFGLLIIQGLLRLPGPVRTLLLGTEYYVSVDPSSSARTSSKSDDES